VPRSVRLNPSLEIRLKQAASADGVRISEGIRRSIAKYCDDVLGASLDARLKDVVGAVRSSGGRARETGAAFTRALRSRG